MRLGCECYDKGLCTVTELDMVIVKNLCDCLGTN